MGMDELMQRYADACRVFRARSAEYERQQLALGVAHRQVEEARNAKTAALWALEAAAERGEVAP